MQRSTIVIESALSIKLAIADCYTCGEALGMTIAPILGFGTLPFRGHATPSNADRLLKEFSGSKTITIQSSFRYDYDKHDTIRFVKKMKRGLQKSRPTAISAEKKARDPPFNWGMHKTLHKNVLSSYYFNQGDYRLVSKPERSLGTQRTSRIFS